jgi:plastocyanin
VARVIGSPVIRNGPDARTADMTRLLTIPLAAVLLAGCGGSGTTGPPSGASPPTTTAAAPAPAVPVGSGPRTVTIADYRYGPATLTVRAGTRVTWRNRDASPHTASAAGLDTGTLTQGGSRTLALRTPGTYRYVCQFHPYMHGTVVVR